MFILPEVIARAQKFVEDRHLSLADVIGAGKDGSVWQTTRSSALKIHVIDSSYTVERNAYMRFRDLNVSNVAGFAIPKLLEFDDELLAIEMTGVTPPYLVDFASAIFDVEPDFIEDDGHTFEDFIRTRFDARADAVLDLYYELAARTGIYLTDMHSQNVKFSNAD
jgi:hypothetical protein